MTPITLEILQAAARSAAAIRVNARLQPAGGPGDKIFPPTYAVADQAPSKYAFENRRVDGETVRCVLVDSVASQANRMEEALLRAWRRGKLELPVIEVDFSAEEGLADVAPVTSLDAPHRIADALLRDSLLEGRLFRFTPPGEAMTVARPDHAAPLFRWCPTALVFGVWDSTGPKGGLGSKFTRAIASEVLGVHAEPGVKAASRLDPMGIQVAAATVYEAADRQELWTLDPDAAATDKGKARKYGKKGEAGKPSGINHGNVAPSIEERSGGVTVDYALHTSVLSLTALRRLMFPTTTSGEPIGREARAAAEDAAHTALAALGLAAMALGRDEGYFFRSRCHLVPEGPMALELVGRDGDIQGEYRLDGDDAMALVHAAAQEAARHGLVWERDVVQLTAAPKLADLIRRSRALEMQGHGEEAG